MPFLTFYTPTYKRPEGLRRCMDSVQAQTIVSDLEHIIVPDYVGLGIGGMYQRVSSHAAAVHGDYVHFLADDDVLAAPGVCEAVRAAAQAANFPPMLLVRVIKGGNAWPQGQPWPPVEGAIDLGCFITRRDVWRAHCHRYGNRYEGDYDFARAVADSGYDAVMVDLLFMVGGVSRGEPEAIEVGPCKWVRA